MSDVPPPPYRAPFLDPRTALVSREWTQWLQAILARLGGVGDVPALDAVASDTLDQPPATSAQLATVLRRLADLETLSGYQVPVPAQATDVPPADPWLGAQVGTLRQRLTDLETREAFGW